jgi:hypothetical protein
MALFAEAVLVVPLEIISRSNLILILGFDFTHARKLSNRIDNFDFFLFFSEFWPSVSARLCLGVGGSLDWHFSRRRSSCVLQKPYMYIHCM